MKPDASFKWIVFSYLTLLFFTNKGETQPSNYYNYTAYNNQFISTCSNYSFTQCPSGKWDWYPDECNSTTGRTCSSGLVTPPVGILMQLCSNGWSSSNCSVPICSPDCTNGRYCAAPYTCICNSSSSDGCVAPCATNDICYPGYCQQGVCVCPEHFTGTHCEILTQKPTIASCSAQLKPPNGPPGSVRCAGDGMESTVSWLTNVNFSFILMWNAYYPSLANPFPNVQIGIHESCFNISFLGTQAESTSSTLVQMSTCNDPAGSVYTINKIWSDFGLQQNSPLLGHNCTIIITVFAAISGTKVVNSNTTSLTGVAVATNKLKFIFDLKPPTHCISDDQSCDIFPIYLKNDITSNSSISMYFYGWSDDLSGLSTYQAYLYRMIYDPVNGFLTLDDHELQSASSYSNAQDFICPGPGIYSILLFVYDNAGNVARARKMFIYDNTKQININSTMPIYIMDATAYKGNNWFTSPQLIGKESMITIFWTNHFSSGSVDYSKPADSINYDPFYEDKYPDKFGQRTMTGLDQALNGILSYYCAYAIDNKTGGAGAVPPTPMTWSPLNGFTQSYSVSVPRLNNGDALTAWVNATDIFGNSMPEKITISVDWTKPNVTSFNFNPKSIDDYHSSLDISVIDRESGIDSIMFNMTDTTLGETPVYTNQAAIVAVLLNSNLQGRKRDVTSTCLANNPTCYCIPTGLCYPVVQQLIIDHCKLARHVGSAFSITFVVYNRAGLSILPLTSYVGVLTDIPCQQSSSFGAGAIAGIVVGVLLFIVLFVNVVLLLCGIGCYNRTTQNATSTIGKFQTKVQHRFSINMDNEAYMPMPLQYSELTNSIQPTLPPPRYTTLPQDSRGVPQGPTEVPQSSTGVQRSHTVLSRVNTLHPPRNNPVQPSIQEPATASTTQQPRIPDDIYVLGVGSEEDDGNLVPQAYRIPSSCVKRADILKEGRFAVIQKASLVRGISTQEVVTKALQNGFASDDASLMMQKIQFMINLQKLVKKHNNIIQLIGAINDENDNGPIMVMELSPISLESWLGKITKVTPGLLSDLFQFVQDIAQGVLYLHSQHITHRRLAVRNVLLVPAENETYTAKLIGFGPSIEDSTDENIIRQIVRPIKWFAPETLDSTATGRPTYDEKTDAWSYGITLWEMYSLGKVPYPENDSGEVQNLLRTGFRLPRPEDCPADLFSRIILPCWNADPAERPTFSTLCKVIINLRDNYL